MSKNLNITVMLGGPSAEREVSLRTGKAAAKALRSLGHRVHEVDPKAPGWTLPEDTQVVFLALHGTYGEDGTVQRELDELGVPYTGCDAESSRVAFDKLITKQRCMAAHIPTARFEVLESAAAAWPAGWQPPVVLKPVRQGSSVGLQYVEREADWNKALAESLRHDTQVLMEEKILGRETTVAILENRALPVVEVRPRNGGFDYHNKYTSGATEYFCPAAFDEAVTRRIQEAALGAFQAVGGRDYARVDVMVRPEGEPVVLEVNTLPGLTELSLFPKAAAAAGIDYAELCQRMVELALRRGPGSERIMSWFKRKPGNRRLGGGHVLDVKLRSEQVRASRLRLAAIVLGLLFATVLGLFALWFAGNWALNRLIYQNKTFAIQHIDVQTDGVIAVDQLRRWAGVKPGQNLLALDLTRVKRDLEMVSAIRSVAVERIMPNTLRLRVAEREPLAQFFVPRLQTNGGYEMTILRLDEEGFVMTQLDPRQRAMPAAPGEDMLPEIRGVNLSEIVPGRRVDTPQIRSALQLVAAFDHSPMAGLVDLQMIDVSAPEIIQVTTTQRSKITFLLGDLDRQLARWRQIYDQGQKQGRAIATLDLSVPGNIPVCFMTAAAAPPVAPRPRNLATNRK